MSILKLDSHFLSPVDSVLCGRLKNGLAKFSLNFFSDSGVQWRSAIN